MSEEGLSTIMQENLLSLLAFDKEHSRTIRGLVDVKLFEGPYREIAQEIYTFIDMQKEPPQDHLPDLFDRILEDKTDRKGKIFRRILKHLKLSAADVKPKFVMSRLAEFVRLQQLKGATTEAIEILREGRIDKDTMARVESIFVKASQRSMEVFESGTFLGDKKKALSFMQEDEADVFRTGIRELDRVGLGPMRRGLHLFIGLPKAGKTWWLVNLGKQGYLAGQNVLHISLEMEEAKMARRYFQTLFAISKRRPKDETEEFFKTEFELDELGKLIGFKRKVVKPTISFEDKTALKKLEKKVDRQKGRLDHIVIKDFPTGQLTIPIFESYLNALEYQQGFIPDLILFDMPLLMKYDHKFQRLILGQITKELRGIAAERNCAVAAVTQSSKKGVGSKQVGGHHAAEDWSQIATADTILTYSQTQEERALGLARIFVDRAREERDQFTILISQHYATGQFCRSSTRMRNNYWNILETYSSEDEDGSEDGDESDSE